MWIAYPVTVTKSGADTHWRRTKEDFFRAAPAISRSFSNYGRPGARVTRTSRLSSNATQALDGYLYEIQGVGAIAALKFSSGAAKSLARPNVNATALLLNDLGLRPNATLVTETIVFNDAAARSAEFRFHVNTSRSDEFVDDELFPRFIAAIAIERMILDLAIETLNSKFVSTRKARFLAASIKFWISRPAIESRELSEAFQGLRADLDLENRSREILDALEEIHKRGNAALLSGTAVGAGLLSITDSSFFALTQTSWWFAISIGVGTITWLIVRGLRR